MESKFIIKFEIDQRDADCITIATDLIDGKPGRNLLIDLCILNNYDEIEEYDGAWENLAGMENFLTCLWDGFIYEPTNRFKIENIEIKGFDGDSMKWYKYDDFSLDKLSEFGITDINEAYEKRIKYFDCEDVVDYNGDDTNNYTR